MIRKTKFSMIRALICAAQGMSYTLDKKDRRLRYIIDAHYIFVWNSQEDFERFVTLSLLRLQKVPGKPKRASRGQTH